MSKFEEELMKLGRKYKIVSNANNENITNDAMVESFKQDIVAASQADQVELLERLKKDHNETCGAVGMRTNVCNCYELLTAELAALRKGAK